MLEKDDGSVIVDQVKRAKGNGGYDANADKMVDDMYKAGIIDPVKVTRNALANAASAAAIFLTTEVAIADEPKEDLCHLVVTADTEWSSKRRFNKLISSTRPPSPAEGGARSSAAFDYKELSRPRSERLSKSILLKRSTQKYLTV